MKPVKAIRKASATAALACLFALPLIAQTPTAPPPAPPADPQATPQGVPAAQSAADAAVQRGDAAASAGNNGAAAPTTNFAFPEEISRKAADAAKHGQAITGQDGSNPLPQAYQPPPAQEEPAAAPEQNTTTSVPPGKLILPNIPVIPSHEDGANGPDGPSSNSYSSSEDEEDPTPANAKDRRIARAPRTPNNSSSAAGPALLDVGSSGSVEAKRIQSDEDVGDFYAQRGNFIGAYLRFKDAVTLAPDEPYAHYGMAEMAVKLGKNDEAVEHYETYLKLEPHGDRSRDAMRSLNLLKSGKAGPPAVSPAEIKQNPLLHSSSSTGK